MDVAAEARQDRQIEQENGRNILQKLCDNGFDGSLGEMIHADASLDEDLEMNIRGIADERGVDIGL